jgi:hypothetical protein
LPIKSFISTLQEVKAAILNIIIILLFSVSTNGQTVYKTPSGQKYHLATCRMVKNVSEEITVSKAKELGLQPCKICNPQNIYYGSGSSTNTPQGQSTTVQCKGTTKAGTRCKHMTSIANGYCYQHQSKN